MRILVTGSTGHLGEALVRALGEDEHDLVGPDVLGSDFTSVVGSIVDRACVRRCVAGADAILDPATLKPHGSNDLGLAADATGRSRAKPRPSANSPVRARRGCRIARARCSGGCAGSTGRSRRGPGRASRPRCG
jgi:NAD(P)-dependent dehydrogenase (short-subunit alcohol dehydrogenase family)